MAVFPPSIAAMARMQREPLSHQRIARFAHDESARPEHDAGLVDDIARARIGTDQCLYPCLLDFGQTRFRLFEFVCADQISFGIENPHYRQSAVIVPSARHHASDTIGTVRLVRTEIRYATGFDIPANATRMIETLFGEARRTTGASAENQSMRCAYQ